MSSFIFVSVLVIYLLVQEAHIDHVTWLGESIIACRKQRSCLFDAVPALSCCVPRFLIWYRLNSCGDHLHLIPLSAVDFVPICGRPVHLLGIPPKDLNTIEVRTRNKVVNGWDWVSWQVVQCLSCHSRCMDRSVVYKDTPFCSKHLRSKSSKKFLKVSWFQVFAFVNSVVNESLLLRYRSTYWNVFLFAVLAGLDQGAACLSPMVSTILVGSKGALINLQQLEAGWLQIVQFFPELF